MIRHVTLCTAPVLFALSAGAQSPEINFPKIDPLQCYPRPPLELFALGKNIEAMEVMYDEHGMERQTRRCTVVILKNGVRCVTARVSKDDMPVKRQRKIPRYTSVEPIIYIPIKRRYDNRYYYADASKGHRRCTKGGRIIRPWETYRGIQETAWDSTWTGDTLVLRSDIPLKESERRTTSIQTWLNGRMLTNSRKTSSSGIDEVGSEERFTYSNDTVYMIRSHIASPLSRCTTVHLRSDSEGKPIELTGMEWVQQKPEPPLWIQRWSVRMAYTEDQLIRMEEWKEGRLRRVLTITHLPADP